MLRIYKAFLNSVRALNYLARNEKAVQQELILFILAVPLALILAPSWLAFLLMMGSILFLIMVEVINTAIEACCNAVTRDFRKDIQISKDCGSLAVLIGIIFAAATWIYILVDTYIFTL